MTLATKGRGDRARTRARHAVPSVSFPRKGLLKNGQKAAHHCKPRIEAHCQVIPAQGTTVGKDHAALIRLRVDSQTADFQQLYRGRTPAIKGVFAEAKERHGLRRAWRRGLTKMRIQCLLIAAVINFKRLLTLLLY